MSTTAIPDRFTTLPDEHTLEATVTALEEHGFSVEVVDDLAAARDAGEDRLARGVEVVDDLHAETVLFQRGDGRRERVLVGQRSEAAGGCGSGHWLVLPLWVYDIGRISGLYPAYIPAPGRRVGA